MDTAIYLRISSDRTGDELGVARQREDARKLCKLRGWRVVEEFTDNDISASGRRQRPGFEAVLQAVRDGRVRCVVAWDMTRITRNSRDRLRLLEAGKEHGVTVAFVRGNDLDLGTPAGRLTADILGSVAQHEIEQKSDRQRRAVVQAVEQGRWIGGRRPFGYEADGVTVRPDEAAAVIEGFEAVLAGVPLGRIAADWNARGLTTPQTRRDGTTSKWVTQSLRPLLLNPRYAGLRSHVTEAMRETMNPRLARIKSISGVAAWPALVSEEIWRAVVDILTDPSRANLPRSGQGLLTGLARCGVCGATVHRGAAPSRRGRPGWPTYRCRAAMGHVGRAAHPVDDYIAELVIGRMEAADAADLLVDDQGGADAMDLRREAGALRRRLESLAGLLADGVLSEAGVRREAAKLRAKLAGVEARQSQFGRFSALRVLVEATDVGETWDGLDTDRQRSAVQALMSVTLLPPGRGTRTFRPESVIVVWEQ